MAKTYISKSIGALIPLPPAKIFLNFMQFLENLTKSSVGALLEGLRHVRREILDPPVKSVYSTDTHLLCDW